MSDNMATIGMINLTPLSLAVDMPPDHAPRSLRPFEAVDCPLWFELRRGNSNVRTKRGNKITLTHALTRDLLSTIDVEMMVSGGQTLPSIITIDTEFVRDPEKQPGPKCGDFIAEIDSYRRSGGQWPHQQLTVINETGRVADAYLLGMKEEKRFEKCLGRIEPGQ